MTKGSNDSTSGKWFNAVPNELHGHRKKLIFFMDSLQDFRIAGNLKADSVRILEVGCSNGRNVSLPLAECGYQFTGIDIHQPSIDWAISHSKFQNANFICQDFFTFDSREKFDVVILSDILEHVDDPLSLLRLSEKHLKFNGIILVCIPNGYGPYEMEQRFIRVTRLERLFEIIKRFIKRIFFKQVEKRREYNYDSGHVNFFQMKDIEKLLHQAGLIITLKSKGALFGGGLTYALGILFPFIIKPSLWLANYLPFWMITTWYFSLKRKI